MHRDPTAKKTIEKYTVGRIKQLDRDQIPKITQSAISSSISIL